VVTVDAGAVEVPPEARQALQRGEKVVVLGPQAPAYVIVGVGGGEPPAVPPGKPLHEALDQLSRLSPADSGFADEMEAILESVGAARPAQKPYKWHL
jgi:hypothetical protein